MNRDLKKKIIWEVESTIHSFCKNWPEDWDYETNNSGYCESMRGLLDVIDSELKAQAKTIVALAEALGTYSHYKNDPNTYAGDILTQHTEAIEMARKELANE